MPYKAVERMLEGGAAKRSLPAPLLICYRQMNSEPKVFRNLSYERSSDIGPPSPPGAYLSLMNDSNNEMIVWPGYFSNLAPILHLAAKFLQ